MRRTLAVTLAVSVTFPAYAHNPVDLLIGTFSNEEQVYFEKEAGRAPPKWASVRISEIEPGILLAVQIDAFGKAVSEPQRITVKQHKNALILDDGKCQKKLRREDGQLVGAGQTGTCDRQDVFSLVNREAITVDAQEDGLIVMRRARAVTCWSAIPKGTKKADGSEDWYFAQNVKIHDQGGRALIGKDVTDVKPHVIRMRNVVWPAGNSNRPSLVLYIHNPDEPDKALSYVWADPGAARIGINLRWMQASCTIDGAEKPGR
jgi:hypothetical protein